MIELSNGVVQLLFAFVPVALVGAIRSTIAMTGQGRAISGVSVDNDAPVINAISRRAVLMTISRPLSLNCSLD